MPSLLTPLRDVPLAFVDVETTGASWAYGHRVIEIGVVRLERGIVVSQYQQLIDPQRPISAGVIALTGITPLMVAGQPTFADQIAPLVRHLAGAIILGHNVRFDLSFLTGEFRRAGQHLPTSVAPCEHVIDTVRIARRRFGRGGNGLQRLSRTLGIIPTAAHRALADAQTTAALFQKLLEPCGGWDTSLADAIAQQGGPMGLLPAEPGPPPLPLELAEALEQKQPVHMEYLDARQQRTHRTIQPLRVRKFNGELILVAHCHLRNDQRTFKLERIIRICRTIEELAAATEPAPAHPLIGGEIAQAGPAA